MSYSNRNELTLKEYGTEQPVWEKIEMNAWHQYSFHRSRGSWLF